MARSVLMDGGNNWRTGKNKILCPSQWYDNMEFVTWCIKINLSFSMLKSMVRNFYLENILEIFMLSTTVITFFFLTCVHLLLFKCNCFRF